MLQVGPGDLGTLLGEQGTMLPGAVEPLQAPEEQQGTLPPELRDLELLPGGQDLQEMLRSLEPGLETLEALVTLETLEPGSGTLGTLEPGSGTLGTLEATELMPSMVGSTDGSFHLSSGSAALLNQHDPFLPQPEDSALPAVNSLFSSTDFPPLHIDASDFQ